MGKYFMSHQHLQVVLTTGIVLVYDVTNEKTFNNITNWLRNIEENAKEDVEKIIVGNKTDLESQRRVSTEKAQKMAIEYGIKLIETSAKVRLNYPN